MTRRGKKRPSRRPPPLSEEQILAWADAHHARFGVWPKQHSGRVVSNLNEKWMNIDKALRVGLRTLPGGSSLARLLAARRGVRNHMDLPHLNREQILAWADAHHARTGEWPTRDSGPIEGTREQSWLAVDMALHQGHRGLPAGSSLAQLLHEERGVRSPAYAPDLTLKMILAWADGHHRRTGQWPHNTSGEVLDAPGETWIAIHTALQKGQRGLPGGSSLARLLERHRGVPNHKNRPELTVETILLWADRHHRRTGKWPKRKSGRIPGSRETWAAVDAALQQGGRGLPGGSSLPQLLEEHRGVRNHKNAPRLTVEQIVAWARAHHQRTGQWPTRGSGVIEGSGGETWSGVDSALKRGKRGLRKSSLSRLLDRHCRG